VTQHDEYITAIFRWTFTSWLLLRSLTVTGIKLGG